MTLDIHWMSLAAIVSLYLISLVFYRLYLHPLARFPGPKLAAATGWYETCIDLWPSKGGMFMETITKMHDKYVGPIVRINPHEIHVRDSTWLTTLYTGSSSGKRNKYAPFANVGGTPKATFGTVAYDLHRLRRAAINPLYSKSAVAGAAPMIYDHTELLLSLLDQQIARDGYTEMRKNYLAFTTENISVYALGQSSTLLENETKAFQWRESIKAQAEWTLLARNFSWVTSLVLKMPVVLLEITLPNFSRIVGSHRDAAKVEGPRDIFQTILSNNNIPLSEKASDRMSQEAFVSLSAGGETLARTMATATYFLLSNKNTVLLRLEEELKTVMPNPSSRPPLKELERLPWLTAVIKESLRIMALFTSRLPILSPDKPLQYKDWVIPAGTPVSMTIRDVLLDPNIYEDPSEFRPERWLSTNPDIEKLNQHFIPFSRGNRICAGMHLAYAELYILVASLFRRRKLELFDTIRERDIESVRDCFIGETSPSSKGVRVKYTEAT
ncbi:putative flavonoid 3-hydroxylase [Biscogniauxia marginata]|nr:putative flavonoid 3-hydroxylase [Biscogniauxia marginata]